MRNSLDIFTVLTLHSILVKSILIILFEKPNGTTLYIPFWLNLYELSLVFNDAEVDFTFHSG